MTLELPKPRDLYFQKQVTQDSIATLTKEILSINEDDEFLVKQYNLYGVEYKPAPIRLYIDSYGGSVYQGLGLLGVMETSKTPIHTYVTGVAMSCGFIISIHGSKRFCYKHTTFMYHQISSAVWGKLADMQQDLDEATRLQDILQDLTCKKTKISQRTLQDNFEHKRDWYMTADQALANGCVDVIL